MDLKDRQTDTNSMRRRPSNVSDTRPLPTLIRLCLFINNAVYSDTYTCMVLFVLWCYIEVMNVWQGVTVTWFGLKTGF